MKKFFKGFLILMAAVVQLPLYGWWEVRVNNQTTDRIAVYIGLVKTANLFGCEINPSIYVEPKTTGKIENDCLYTSVKITFPDTELYKQGKGQQIEKTYRAKTARGINLNLTVSGTYPNYTLTPH